MKRRHFLTSTTALAMAATFGLFALPAHAESKEIIYITPSMSVSFWRYMATGAEAAAKEAGYTLQVLDSNNDAQVQLKNVQDAIARDVAGIILSPTDSSTAPSVLALAQEAGIPVTISDIGTTEGEYVSFISSDNAGGARGIGDALAAKLTEMGFTDGSYGIIGIPQARINGQLRTQGFRDAMAATGMTKEAPMQEMKTFTADESFKFAQDMMTATPDLRAIFVQSDQQTVGAFRAVEAARKTADILVVGFDGTPELFQLIADGKIVGSGMQQPYLMGNTAAAALLAHIAGTQPEKSIVVPILIGTTDNAADLLDEIKLNVFANDF